MEAAGGFANIFPVFPNTLGAPGTAAPNKDPGGLFATPKMLAPGAVVVEFVELPKLNRPVFGGSLPSFAAGYEGIPENRPPVFGGNSSGLSEAGLSTAEPNKVVPDEIPLVRLPKIVVFFSGSLDSALGNSLPANVPPEANWNFFSELPLPNSFGASPSGFFIISATLLPANVPPDATANFLSPKRFLFISPGFELSFSVGFPNNGDAPLS